MKTKKKRKAAKKPKSFKPKQELHGTASLRPYPPVETDVDVVALGQSIRSFYDELVETADEVEPIFSKFRRRAKENHELE